MKLTNIVISVLCANAITGCAEFAEVNKQVGEWAGKMIEIRDGQQSATTTSSTTRVEHVSFETYTKNVTSQSSIDTLFVKLKRDLKVKTIEAVPNVYYKLQMAESDPKYFPTYFTTTIILEKEGKKVNVRWEIYSTEDYAKRLERKIMKAVK